MNEPTTGGYLLQQDETSSMVSELTGRLLAGYSSGSGGSLDSNPKKRKNEPDSSNRSGNSSGYAADEDVGGLPPTFVGFQTKTTKSTDGFVKSSSTNVDGNGNEQVSAKRRKIMEREYAAFNVKAELARSGITMPKPRLTSPRILPPLCGIDMSRVSLIRSSEFSPNLVYKGASNAIMNPDHRDICFQSILSLTEACKGFYKLPSPEAKPLDGDRSDDGSSTASSVTESDEDDHPKPFMAMCEALSLCKQPRIVVLSTAPFTVVHVNAAYLQLTGLSSVRLLGQPFQDLILDGKWTAALSHSTRDGECFDLRQMHKRVVKTRTGVQKGDPMQCMVSASPIGVSADRITHFALVLEQNDGKEQNNIRSNSMIDLSIEESAAPAMTVSG